MGPNGPSSALKTDLSFQHPNDVKSPIMEKMPGFRQTEWLARQRQL